MSVMPLSEEEQQLLLAESDSRGRGEGVWDACWQAANSSREQQEMQSPQGSRGKGRAPKKSLSSASLQSQTSTSTSDSDLPANAAASTSLATYAVSMTHIPVRVSEITDGCNFYVQVGQYGENYIFA